MNMAPKKKQQTWSNPPQYEDMTTRQQTALNKQMNAAGKSVVESAATAHVKYIEAAQDPTNTPDYQAKSASRAGSLERVMPVLANRPVTLAGAAQRRGDLVQRAAEEARTRTALSGTPQALPGAGWYYTHRERIMAGAQGVPAERAIAASAVMSPGKDPETQEVIAAHGVIGLHTTDPIITERTGSRGRVVRSQRYSEMSSGEVARLASKAAAENDKGVRAARAGRKPPKKHVSTEPEEALTSLANAGQGHRPNVEKSVNIVRGEAEPRGMGGPKIEAYNAGIQHALPPPTDYQSIGRHYVHEDPNQGMFIFSDERPVTSAPSTGGFAPAPKESILSPEHITAEDTWMHAISSNQPMGYRGESGRMISPAKRAVDKGGPLEFAAVPEQRGIGTHGDPGIDPAGLSYAWHNKATRMAARNIPVTHSQHGEIVSMPSVMVQEVAWTQGRREAGADAPYNAELRALGKATQAQPEPSGQLEMFPERTGAKNRISR